MSRALVFHMQSSIVAPLALDPALGKRAIANFGNRSADMDKSMAPTSAGHRRRPQRLGHVLLSPPPGVGLTAPEYVSAYMHFHSAPLICTSGHIDYGIDYGHMLWMLWSKNNGCKYDGGACRYHARYCTTKLWPLLAAVSCACS